MGEKKAEIPPLILNGGRYCSDIRTPPSFVQKIPFLKCLKAYRNIALSES